MSTIRQQLLAKRIFEAYNTGKVPPMYKLMEICGYKPGTLSNPKQIMKGGGFREEMEKLGFDETNAIGVINEILLNKQANPKDRLKAAEQVFKITGAYAPRK